MRQFVYGGSDVSLLHSTLFQLFHGVDELKMRRKSSWRKQVQKLRSKPRSDSLNFNLSDYLFAIILETLVGFNHLTLRERKKTKREKISTTVITCWAPNIHVLVITVRFRRIWTISFYDFAFEMEVLCINGCNCKVANATFLWNLFKIKLKVYSSITFWLFYFKCIVVVYKGKIIKRLSLSKYFGT